MRWGVFSGVGQTIVSFIYVTFCGSVGVCLQSLCLEYLCVFACNSNVKFT